MSTNSGPTPPTPGHGGAELVPVVSEPKSLTFDEIARNIEYDKKLGFLDRCMLAKQQTRALVEQRKQQIAGTLQVQGMKIDADVSMAARAIALYRDQFEFEIRGGYIRMLAVLGGQVESSQLEFLADFGEQLSSFEKKLESREIKPEFKERIVGAMNKAFDRLFDKLDALTEEVILKAQQQK